MSKYALGCIVDGFSGPESLNQRSIIVLEKITSLYEQLTKDGHYVEIWIPRWKLSHPRGQTLLYQLVFITLAAYGIPASCIRITDQSAYNALSDGAALANCASMRNLDYYIFVVPNFRHYFLMTYVAMRKYMCDGQNWKNISVISTGHKTSFRAFVLYSVLTLITAVASQNKWLWKQWFNIRAKDQAKREEGFIGTVG